MKPSTISCYKLCPIHFIGIFLALNVMIWATVASLMYTTWFALSGIYIFYALVKLSNDLQEKCESINIAGMHPTGLYYKNGKPQMIGTNYAMAAIGLIMAISLITGFISLFKFIITTHMIIVK